MNNKKWVVKNLDGRVFGPHSTEKIIKFIKKGVLTGEELIQEFPGGDWTSLGIVVEFGDEVLNSIAQTDSEGFAHLNQDQVEQELKQGSKLGTDRSELSSKKTTLLIDEDKTIIESKNLDKNADKISDKTEVFIFGSKEDDDKTYMGPDSEMNDKTWIGGGEPPKTQIFETPIKKKPIKKKSKNDYNTIITILVGLGFVLFFLINQEDSPSDKVPTGFTKIHFIVPQSSSEVWNSTQIKNKMLAATEGLSNDLLQENIKAQNSLVQVVEHAPQYREGHDYLCLVYKELWPFSYQDNNDTEAVKRVLAGAQKNTQIGERDSVCEAVLQYINYNLESAERLLNDEISLPKTKDRYLLSMIFDFKAELLFLKGDFLNSLKYVKRSQEYWPKWLKAKRIEGDYRFRAGQTEIALEIYKKLITTGKENPLVYIKYGQASAKLNDFQNAIKFINQGIQKTNQISTYDASEGYRTLALIYFSLRKSDFTLQMAKNAYILNPADRSLYNMIIQFGGSPSVLNKSISTEELMLIGEKYFKDKNFIGAQAQFRAILDIQPTNSHAAYMVGKSMWNLNQRKQAIEYLSKAIKSNEKNLEYHLTLADYYEQVFDFVGAGKVLEKVRKPFKDRYELFRGLALFELRRKNPDAAIKFAEQALDKFDSDIETFKLLSQVHYLKENYQDSFTWAARAIELDGGDVEAQLLYSKALSFKSSPEIALKYLKDIIKINPTQIQYRIGIADLYYKNDKYKETAAVCEQIIKSNKTHKKAYILMSKAYAGLLKPDKSISALIAAAVIDAADPEPPFLLGEAYLENKRAQAAIEQFSNVIKVNSFFPKAFYYLGKAYFMLGESQKALEALTTESRQNPNLVDTFILLGEIYLSLKDSNKASLEFQKVLSLNVKSADLYIKLARAYRMMDQFDVAEGLLQEARKLESGNPEVFKEEGELYGVKEDSMSAISAFKTYLKLVPNAIDKKQIEAKIRQLGGMP